MQLQDMSELLSCVNTMLKTTAPQSEESMVKLVITAVILLLTVSGVSTGCAPTEYLTGQKCCPMCRPGFCVQRHCTEFFSTECVLCPSSFYTDTLNNLESCSPCTVCDSSAGLRVKRPCSSTSDTLCEPLESHYCTDPIKDGCRGAVEHTKCSSGRYIKQPGTSSSDTVCGDCVGDTYSNGTFTSCRPHTQCELLGLYVTRKGSTSYDTECAERKNTVAIVVSVVAVIVLICGVLVGLFILWKKKKPKPTTPQDIFLEKDLIGPVSDHIVTTEEQGESCSVMAAVP
ncbi:tumor necrosis factor receptor superfamily member 14-like [Alosa alosa]|uniref:tumor necrosis factor receptor superfamily member 14-like n=1 Tax=Alosa alosa TaxID=278164 RepID=UPI0020151DA0|nr:tumor necrosis factor receptor superfamily member 14-like [Alosa alosa]